MAEDLSPDLLIQAHREGAKMGIWLFAWWKDGVQYVGNGGRTLADCYRIIDEMEEKQFVHHVTSRFPPDPERSPYEVQEPSTKERFEKARSEFYNTWHAYMVEAVRADAQESGLTPSLEQSAKDFTDELKNKDG